MQKMNKIISAIVSIAFLFNTVAADLAFGQTMNARPNVDKLAVPSVCGKLAGIERSDIVRIKYALICDLMKLAGKDVSEFEIRNLDGKTTSVNHPRNMQFFFRERINLKKDGSLIAVRCRIKEENAVELRDYYAIFEVRDGTLIRVEPLEVYTAKHFNAFKKSGAFKKALPRLDPEDAKFMEADLQHELGMDTILRYAHENGLALEPIISRFDYKTEMNNLMRQLKINVINPYPDRLIPPQERKFFFVKVTPEIRQMMKDLPKLKVMIKDDIVEVPYYSAHSSNGAMHVFIEDLDAFNKFTDTKMHCKPDTFQSMIMYLGLDRILARELGAMVNSPVLNDADGWNEMDRRYSEYLAKGRVDGSVWRRRIADLDTAAPRDYADGTHPATDGGAGNDERTVENTDFLDLFPVRGPVTIEEVIAGMRAVGLIRYMMNDPYIISPLTGAALFDDEAIKVIKDALREQGLLKDSRPVDAGSPVIRAKQLQLDILTMAQSLWSASAPERVKWVEALFQGGKNHSVAAQRIAKLLEEGATSNTQGQITLEAVLLATGIFDRVEPFKNKLITASSDHALGESIKGLFRVKDPSSQVAELQRRLGTDSLINRIIINSALLAHDYLAAAGRASPGGGTNMAKTDSANPGPITHIRVWPFSTSDQRYVGMDEQLLRKMIAENPGLQNELNKAAVIANAFPLPYTANEEIAKRGFEFVTPTLHPFINLTELKGACVILIKVKGEISVVLMQIDERSRIIKSGIIVEGPERLGLSRGGLEAGQLTGTTSGSQYRTTSTPGYPVWLKYFEQQGARPAAEGQARPGSGTNMAKRQAGASPDEVKSAYEQLRKRLHPRGDDVLALLTAATVLALEPLEKESRLKRVIRIFGRFRESGHAPRLAAMLTLITVSADDEKHDETNVGRIETIYGKISVLTRDGRDGARTMLVLAAILAEDEIGKIQGIYARKRAEHPDYDAYGLAGATLTYVAAGSKANAVQEVADIFFGAKASDKAYTGREAESAFKQLRPLSAMPYALSVLMTLVTVDSDKLRSIMLPASARTDGGTNMKKPADSANPGPITHIVTVGDITIGAVKAQKGAEGIKIATVQPQNTFIVWSNDAAGIVADKLNIVLRFYGITTEVETPNTIKLSHAKLEQRIVLPMTLRSLEVALGALLSIDARPGTGTHMAKKPDAAQALERSLMPQINTVNDRGLYSTEIIHLQGHVLVKFTDKKEPDTHFTVMVDKGFRVISWSVAGTERFRVPQDLDNDLGAGIFSMFPWVNRIKDGTIIRNGREIDISSIPGLSMDKGTPNPIHGVARVSETWKEVSIGVDDGEVFIQASFETTDYPGLAEALGHSKLTKKFYLAGHDLNTTVKVENLTTAEEAARDGGYEVIADVGEHPFMNYTPWRTKLQAAVTGVFPVDEQKIPTGNPVRLLSENSYNEPTLVTSVLDNTFTVRADAQGVVTAIWADELNGTTTFRMTGMFSAKPGEEAVVHFWGGNRDNYLGVGAVEAVAVTANGPNRQGQVGGSRPLAKGEAREGSVIMTITTVTPVAATATVLASKELAGSMANWLYSRMRRGDRSAIPGEFNSQFADSGVVMSYKHVGEFMAPKFERGGKTALVSPVPSISELEAALIGLLRLPAVPAAPEAPNSDGKGHFGTNMAKTPAKDESAAAPVEVQIASGGKPATVTVGRILPSALLQVSELDGRFIRVVDFPKPVIGISRFEYQLFEDGKVVRWGYNDKYENTGRREMQESELPTRVAQIRRLAWQEPTRQWLLISLWAGSRIIVLPDGQAYYLMSPDLELNDINISMPLDWQKDELLLQLKEQIEPYLAAAAREAGAPAIPAVGARVPNGVILSPLDSMVTQALMEITARASQTRYGRVAIFDIEGKEHLENCPLDEIRAALQAGTVIATTFELAKAETPSGVVKGVMFRKVPESAVAAGVEGTAANMAKGPEAPNDETDARNASIRDALAAQQVGEAVSRRIAQESGVDISVAKRLFPIIRPSAPVTVDGMLDLLRKEEMVRKGTAGEDIIISWPEGAICVDDKVRDAIELILQERGMRARPDTVRLTEGTSASVGQAAPVSMVDKWGKMPQELIEKMKGSNRNWYLGINSSTQSVTFTVIDFNTREIIWQWQEKFDDEFYRDFNAPKGSLPSQDPKLHHTDPLMLVAALDKGMRELSSALKCYGWDINNIRAISGAGQQHGTVYYNAEAERILGSLDPARPLAEQIKEALSRKTAPIWRDKTTVPQQIRAEKFFGGAEGLRQKTGSAGELRFGLLQVMKFYEEEPDAYSATSTIVNIAGFNGGLLSGIARFPFDYGDAAGSNAMDIRTNQWLPEIDQLVPGLRARLPDIKPTNHMVGPISKYWTKYGFSPDTKIVNWTGDNPSAMAGQGITGKGQVGISLGTSFTIYTYIDEAELEKTLQSKVGNVFKEPTGKWMKLVCFQNGGLALEKVRDKYIGNPEAIDRLKALGITRAQFADDETSWQKRVDVMKWDIFNEEVSKASVGNEGSMMITQDTQEEAVRIPYIEGKPFTRNLDLATASRSKALRAAVEGQIYFLKWIADQIGLDVKEINLTGGSSKNPVIRRIMADIFNAKVNVLKKGYFPNEPVSLGGAINAAKAHMDSLSEEKLPWEEANKGLVALDTEMTTLPDAFNVSAYNLCSPQYDTLVKEAMAAAPAEASAAAVAPETRYEMHARIVAEEQSMAPTSDVQVKALNEVREQVRELTPKPGDEGTAANMAKEATQSTLKNIFEQMRDTFNIPADDTPKAFAEKAGKQIYDEAKGQYTLIVPREFVSKGELDSDIGKYGDRFGIIKPVSGLTKGIDDYIASLKQCMNGPDEKVDPNTAIALLPKGITSDQVEALQKEFEGLRFLPADMGAMNLRGMDKETRATHRADTYALMFLARHIKEGDHSSYVYAMLNIYLADRVVFEDGQGLTVTSYIDAIAKNEIGKLVNGWIRPAEGVKANEDNRTISESLIFA